MLQYLIIDSNLPILTQNTPPKRFDRVRDRISRKHYYSIRTEKLYAQWIKRFILFHGERYPFEMGAVEVEAFLAHLAAEGKVSASMQNHDDGVRLNYFITICQTAMVRLPWHDWPQVPQHTVQSDRVGRGTKPIIRERWASFVSPSYSFQLNSAKTIP